MKHALIFCLSILLDSSLAEARHPDYLSSVRKPEASWNKTQLTDSEGKVFRLDQLQGRLLLINFFFTSCPSICVPQTAGLVKTWERLPEPLRSSLVILSISLDPKHDDQEKLAAYKQRFGIKSPSWTFANGTEAEIRSLATQLGSVSDERDPLEHRGRLYLLDSSGRFVRAFASAPALDSQSLALELSRALRALTKELDPKPG